MQKILTVPSVIERGDPYLLTGNHYVSLPRIGRDGVVRSIAFLSAELRALTEFSGALTPFVRADGADVPVLEAGYTHDFLPTFSGKGNGLSFTLSYVAPERLHGFVCRFCCRAERDLRLDAGLTVAVERATRAVFRSYELAGRINAFFDRWTGTLICELIAGKSYGGFGVCGDNAEITATETGGTVQSSVPLHAGDARELLFYVSVGAETDGIGLVAMDLRRRGADSVSSQEALLDRRHIALPNKVLERYANFNLNFCYYFSCGYTLDTDELCLVTSKSTAYYVSAAFWSRDSFLWAFPALLRVSPALAREALLCGFGKYARRIGVHALYLDGTVLYPGFELDEQVAPVLALKRYVEQTGDPALLETECVQSGLAAIKRELLTHYDARAGLFTTELDSSDDPVTNAFNTYDNALCRAALEFLGERALAERVGQALRETCVTTANGKPAFAYSAEGERRRLYDNPPGSLSLLSCYGAATRGDPLFENTLAYIYSPENPYYYENGALFGAGCEHTPYPWAASLVNRIHGRGYAEERVLSALEAVARAYPIVCESFSLSDGGLNTGDAFATMAGYVADGIFTAYNK